MIVFIQNSLICQKSIKCFDANLNWFKSDYLETLVCALDLCLSSCITRRAILILLLINSIQIISLKNLGEQVFLKVKVETCD